MGKPTMSHILNHALQVPKNSEGKDFFVGDVHGCFDKLEQQLVDMSFRPGLGDRLFSVGDLIDRGAESHMLPKWLDMPWFYAVIGNHEDFARMYYLACDMNLDKENYASQAIKDQWVRNGGGWFFSMSKQEQEACLQAILKMPFIIELETHLGLIGIIHAQCPLDDWKLFREHINNDDVAFSALWNRERIAGHMGNEPVKNIYAVVSGHTPHHSVVKRGNNFFIDSGAWAKGDKPFFIINTDILHQYMKES